jgi:hypothetical protein
MKNKITMVLLVLFIFLTHLARENSVDIKSNFKTVFLKSIRLTNIGSSLGYIWSVTKNQF